jgi:uncharacterized protein (TIGR03083 family)
MSGPGGKMAAVDAKVMARDERAELVDLLRTLTPEQWRTPSLCAGWRVRDVVAHVFSYEGLPLTELFGRLLRSGLALGRANALGIAAHSGRSTDELVALAANHLTPSGLTTAFGGRVALTDALIHHQDIRRPLGLSRDIPPERLTAVLGFAVTAPPLGARSRIRGLTLTATDTDWTVGAGPEVTGPAEALLMAIAGRPGVVGELAGPGCAELTRRIGG